MISLIVVNQPKDWTKDIVGGRVISAKAYLTDPEFASLRGVRVYNLCRSYRYQAMGYYVSLLADARGHKPLPSIATIQDLKSPTLMRFAGDELEEVIQKSMAPIHSPEFTLSIYFGRNMARRHDRLSSRLFRLFPAPLLRAHFVRDNDGTWELQSVRPVPTGEIPDDHWPFLIQFASDYFEGYRPNRGRESDNAAFDLAILHDPKEDYPPSNDRALKKFMDAAEDVGFEVEMITREDYGRLAEFDALFIRETTNVNHHTYRFARRAAAEGLVVMDDPQSILLCTNKVYLAEALRRQNIRMPKTLIVHRDNVKEVVACVGLPCILKQPDSAFSQGVVKVTTEEELQAEARRLFDKSDLIIAQEFLPTGFDWRIGILDRKPLYACKYHMPGNHWQIMKHQSDGETDFGDVEPVPLDKTPPDVVATALKAANLIGDGLYGVDLKEVNGKVHVVEINDNPSIDAGYEDAIMKDQLYRSIMQVFLQRIEARKKRKSSQ